MFVGICNPDAANIRICNPIKAHGKGSLGFAIPTQRILGFAIR